MRLFIAAVGAALLLSPAVVSARPAALIPAGAPSAAVDAAAVVAEVRRVITERYVLPERRAALDAVLAEGLSSGRYDGTDATALAERINEDLERVGRDRHLNFRLDPRQAAILSANSSETPDSSGFERMVRTANHGVTELKVLPGNVRVMTYDGFHWMGDESATALEGAMRFLSGGDAVIIDLRRNGGGDPAAVQYIISHFLPAETPLVTFYMYGRTDGDTRMTLAEVPAGRMEGRPLYVLTSGGTGSAAEEFTGHVLGYHLGQTVGETTSGAGFRNELVPVEGQFVLSVSVGRAVLASTGKDWEATGHAATLPVPVAQALDVAYGRALSDLATAAMTPEDRARLQATAEGVSARGEARAAAHPLQAYAGVYGERTVRVEGDHLTFQRVGRPLLRLITLGGDRFALDVSPGEHLTFDVTGGTATTIQVSTDGAPVRARYERTGPAAP